MATLPIGALFEKTMLPAGTNVVLHDSYPTIDRFLLPDETYLSDVL